MKRKLLLLISILSAYFTASIAQTAYIVDNEGVRTFYYDNNQSSRTGTIYDLNAYAASSSKATIRKVIYDASFANYQIIHPSYVKLTGYTMLEDVEGLENLNTRNVTDMSSMFEGCENLESLDLSKFNTQDVVYMYNMFFECRSLKNLNLSNLDTHNVTSMYGMFHGCSSLTSLNLNNIDTRNVINMSGMFYGCSNLTSLDVRNFNTENVKDMTAMFYDCSSLTSLDLSSFNTGNVMGMAAMFYGCSSLTSLDLSSFNTENVKEMYSMFNQCTGLRYLNISNFSRKSLENATAMFYGCSETMQLITPNDWYIDDISVTETNVIVGDYIYTLYQDHHADMKGIVNSLSGDVIIPATFEYEGGTYNVKNVNSVTNLYYLDETTQRYDYVSANSYSSGEGIPVPDYTKLTSMTFENGIESVSDSYLYMYWYCKSVNIPKSVKYISPETYYMKSLSNSGYRDEVRAEGFSPNAGQVIFNDITYNVDSDNATYTSVDGVLYDKDMKTLLRCPKGKEGVFVVPDGVEKIDRFAFMHCLLLTEIKLPTSVKVLGDDGGEQYSSSSRLFSHCYSLEKVNIPEGVERLESMSFRYCISLKGLTIPNSLKYYHSSALSATESLEYLDWQDCKLDTIDMLIKSNYTSYNLFDGMNSCVVSLPKYVKHIIPSGILNFALFASGSVMPETLTLPASIEEFAPKYFIGGYNASTNLANLKTLYVLMDFMPDIDERFFGYDQVRVGKKTVNQFPQTWANQCTLYVPENLVEAYKAHAVWGKFPNIVGVEVTREIEPIETETTIAFAESDFVNADNMPVDLNNTVVNDTYFSINNNSNSDGYYDATDQCIVISKTTANDAMTTVMASELGSADFVSNYTGMVVEINGAGSIKIKAQTVGNIRLAVKTGNADAKAYEQAEKGDIIINYNISENTYVYIYAVDANNQQQSLNNMDITDSENAVKVYSVTVIPSVTAIENVSATIPSAVYGKIYSIDGKQISQPQKGLNILRMSDGTTRKIVR